MLIYVITNVLSGKQYVGQTVVSMEARWKRHCWKSNTMVISLAIQKYGREYFTIRQLEECDTLDELNAAELRWANNLSTFSPNGYNLKAGGGLGSMSEETKAKIGASNRGQKRSAVSRKRMSEAHKGIRLSEATKAKLSAHWKGKRASDLAYKNLAISCAKTYRLVSPDGEQMTVTNMRTHCRSFGLSPSKMCLVVNGKRTHHKGWSGSIV